MTVPLNAFLVLAGLMFAIGFFGVLVRRNTLVIYMCLELMLNAVNLALVAAAEVAVGLALIVALYRRVETVMVDKISALKN